MDVVKIEAFSFIRQEITRRLIIVSRSQNQSPLARSVIDTVIDYFSTMLNFVDCSRTRPFGIFTASVSHHTPPPPGGRGVQL